MKKVSSSFLGIVPHENEPLERGDNLSGDSIVGFGPISAGKSFMERLVQDRFVQRSVKVVYDAAQNLGVSNQVARVCCPL